MDFNQLMNQIFGAQWLGTVTQIASGAVMLFLSAFYAKIKNKLLTSNNENAKVVGKFLDENIKIKEQLETQQGLNAELQAKQEQTTNAVTSLVNIIGMTFLDSKGVTPETKLAIGNVIGKLQATGVNLDDVNKTIEHTTTVAENSIKVVNAIKESAENTAKDANQTAEGIAQASVDIYNLISNNNEQQG